MVIRRFGLENNRPTWSNTPISKDGSTMGMLDLFKSLSLRFVPESLLGPLRRMHYIRKLRRAPDEPEMALLRRLTPSGGIAVDVGANFGLYTKCLSEQVGDRGCVLSFEPIPPTFDVLSANAAELQLDNVITHRMAVSDHDGSTTMYVPEYTSGGWNFYEASVHGSAGHVEQFNVPCCRLDSALDAVHRLDVLKIDVEGHEAAVIEGGWETLRRFRPACLIEVSGDPDVPGSCADRLFVRLAELGYAPYCLDGSSVRVRQRGDRRVNYYFLTPEHVRQAGIATDSSVPVETAPVHPATADLQPVAG